MPATWSFLVPNSRLQFPNKFFRVVLPDYSYVVVPRQHLKEMFSAPEDLLSFTTPVVESLAAQYTFQKSVAYNQYHALVVKAELTRHIPQLMPDIVEELEEAISDQIPLTDGTFFQSMAEIKIGRRSVHLTKPQK